MFEKFIIETWRLLNEMSPYLLFGFLIAGFLKILIPREKIYYHLSAPDFSAVLKSALFGIPLPLCSCGVIPVATHIKKEGASDGATVSFLISTPTTGVDSILATYSLLGPVFAIIRPVSALFAGISGGWLVNILNRKGIKKAKEVKNFICNVCEEEGVHTHSPGEKMRVILKYGFSELIEDIGKWIVIGVLAGGIIATFVPGGIILRVFGKPFYSYSLMLIIGIPMYVCATGSIPIAASLISKGMLPGAGLVFLFTGPATNSATLAFVLGKMGRKNFLVYLASIIFWSVIFGLIIDYIWKFSGAEIINFQRGKFLPLWLKTLSSIILLFLIVRTIKFREKKVNMKEFEVVDMKCNHCVKTIEDAFKKEGINAEVNLKSKKVYVPDEIEDEKVEKIIEKIGYTLKRR